ncbi:MAG: hypothetical protein CM1200mP24_07600 [Gammaproteobacteria bacterium]|nr:MAG: hypothetical protein CM1200mP24_07600 [Gammaproteobacteria bacterium]
MAIQSHTFVSQRIRRIWADVKSAKNNQLSAFLEQMECPSLVDSKKMLLEGGPVGFDPKGFILHSNDVMTDDSQILCKNLALTTSKDLLRRIGEG